MPIVSDVAEIRAILERDRGWAAYALADLEPDQLGYCTWVRTTTEPPSVALIYRAFAAPVLITVGPAEQIAELLDEFDREFGGAATACLVCRPDVFALLADHYEITESKRMVRMTLANRPRGGHPDQRVCRVLGSDLAALKRLYADGIESGEQPDYFTPEMLHRGIYYGVWEKRDLIVAAGTHVVAPSVGVGAIGNVYTRRDRRGRGLGTAVTRAVSAALQECGIETIVLNVWSRNPTAIGIYERLGFRRHCEFYEATARTNRANCES